MANLTEVIKNISPTTGKPKVPNQTFEAAKQVVNTPSSQINPTYGYNLGAGDVTSLQDSIAKKFGITPTPAGSGISDVASPNNISGGSEPVTDQMAANKTEGQKMLDQLQSSQDLFTSQLGAQQQSIQDLINATKVLTDADLKKIEQAGAAAGLQYDPLIEQAKEARRQGMAKSTVGAGQVGGFMNTQFAGQAALTPIEGDSFVGAGGELSKVKGQLDQNISQLENAKLQAIAAAKIAAEKAIKTGKREDVDSAMTLYNLSKDTFEAQQAAISKRVEVIGALQNIQQSGVKFSWEEAKQKFDQLENIALVGGVVDPALKQQLEAQYGAGFVDKYMETAKKVQNADDEAKQVDAATDLYKLLSGVPVGTKIKVGESTYEGLATSDPNTQVFAEEDAFGNMTYVTIDKNTGEIIASASGGKIGKGFKGSAGGGGGGGGKSGADDKDIKAFQKDAADLILKLEKGDTTWAGAFDSLKIQYPKATNDTINAALGGGIPYSPEGGFDTSAAFGRAKTKK